MGKLLIDVLLYGGLVSQEAPAVEGIKADLEAVCLRGGRRLAGGRGSSSRSEDMFWGRDGTCLGLCECIKFGLAERFSVEVETELRLLPSEEFPLHR